MLTFPCGDAIAFIVKEAIDLGQIALALDDVFNGGGFHQICIVALFHPGHALRVTLDEHVRIAAHVLPHFFVCLNVGILFVHAFK